MPETERPKFLLELLAEIDNFDSELFPPKHPVSKETKDTVVGTLAPWLRQLYSFARYSERQAKLLCVEREYDSGEAVRHDNEIAAFVYRHELAMGLLWAAIRAQFGIFDADSVGLREGWQVVTSEKEAGPKDLGAFLDWLRKK